MTAMAKALAAAGLRVVRFEFGYMAARRSGTRKPPPRAERVLPEFVAAIDDLGPTDGPLIIGGKSMGGRVASLLADELLAARPRRRPALPRLSLPSARPAGAIAHRPPRRPRHADAHLPGHARSLRPPRGGRNLRPLPRHRAVLARGRRSRPQAAQIRVGLYRRATTSPPSPTG